MPSIGSRCHELRINDEDKTWRIIYRINAIVVVDVFAKKTNKTRLYCLSSRSKYQFRIIIFPPFEGKQFSIL